MRKQFNHLLVNTFIANVTTSFLWFALTFWVYLETQSVLATSIIGGAFMLFIAAAGVPFGSWVDRTRKKTVMVSSTAFTVVAFALAFGLYLITPTSVLLTLSSWQFMVFVSLILAGSVVESARGIALSTCVTLMVPEPERAQVNGLVGMVLGFGMAVTSVFSGLAIGQLGMTWTIAIAVVMTLISLVHLLPLKMDEPDIVHLDETPKMVDFGGAYRAVRDIPGLTGLILFAAFNNLLGGAFISLMDPYGLTLVSVEVWGVLWGVLSFGFIIGAGLVSKIGLGSRPLRLVLLCNLAMWTVSMAFTIRENIWLLTVGVLVYMALIPVVEASEQTLLQKVVPYAKQGRVFGLAQTVELAAAPVSAFLIGPLAEFWLIPYSKSEAGIAQWSWLVGEGQARGIALVFLLTGVAGLALTLFAFTTRSYRLLSKRYAESDVNADFGADAPDGELFGDSTPGVIGSRGAQPAAAPEVPTQARVADESDPSRHH